MYIYRPSYQQRKLVIIVEVGLLSSCGKQAGAVISICCNIYEHGIDFSLHEFKVLNFIFWKASF